MKGLGMNYSGSTFYHSLQNVLSCCLLSKWSTQRCS